MPSARLASLKQFVSRVLVAVVFLQHFAFMVPATEAATQNGYHWRNDDGSESLASYDGAENAPLTSLPQTTTKRLRFGQANSGSESELARIADVTLDGGEEQMWSAVIDSTNGYAYFGTYTNPGIVVKVKLGAGNTPPTRIGAVTLDAGEDFLNSAIIDVANGYAYFGTDVQPGKIIKIDLGAGDTPPTRVAALTLNSGEGYLYASVIDTDNGVGYFGSQYGAAKVTKIDLGVGNAAPTRVGTVTFGGGEDSPMSAVIDTVNDFAYFGTDESPAKVVKIDTSPGNFSYVGSITLNSGENFPYAAVFNPLTGYAYFGTYTFPARVVKVDTAPGNFTRIGAVTLDSGEDGIFNSNSSAIDPVNGFAYFGTDTSPGIVVKVGLGAGAAPPTREAALTLDAGDETLYNALLDPVHGYAYFGSYVSSPTVVVKVSVAPKAEFRLEYGAKVSTCAAIGSWTQVPATATTEHFEMSPSGNVSNAGATTNSVGVTDGNSAFQPGYIMDTASQTPEVSYGENQFTEIEYSIQATTNSVPAGDYCFRLTDAGSPSAFTYTNYAEATIAGAPPAPSTNTTSNRVLMSRIKAGAASDVAVSFDLAGTLSSDLVITFDPAFTGLNAASAVASTPGAPGCITGISLTGPNEITATKSNCTGSITISGITLTNPGTPGSYLVSWVNDSPGYALVAITDDDQVTVSAQISPTITFDLDTGIATGETAAPYNVALGALTVGAVNHSDNAAINSIFAQLDTNATGGAQVTVLSANAALKSTSVPADAIPNSAASMAAGTANYGICVNSVTPPTQSSGTFQPSAPYNAGTCSPAGSTNDVKALSAVTPTNILDSAAAPLTSGSAEILVNAAIDTSTVAHSDYTDTLTFVATGTF